MTNDLDIIRGLCGVGTREHRRNDGRIVGVSIYHGIYKATAKEMRTRVVHIWKLQDKKILAFEQFTDTFLGLSSNDLRRKPSRRKVRFKI